MGQSRNCWRIGKDRVDIRAGAELGNLVGNSLVTYWICGILLAERGNRDRMAKAREIGGVVSETDTW